MTTTVRAWGAPGVGEPLEPLSIERRDLRPDDVLIDIAYCGICHSDLSTVLGAFGERKWPLVPGHEIAGRVAAVGSDVTEFRVGDHAGIGCMVDSCGECEYCRRGEEQYCEHGMTATYGADLHGYGRDLGAGGAAVEYTHGGYSQQIVVREAFVIHIPETLDLASAAPLMCAGVTTFSPLNHWGVGEGSRVAVVGMGGLGHMGVQIASAMGAEVTVLSHSLAKKDDGLALGATDYVATADPEVFRSLRGRFDFILNTVSAPLDYTAHMATLRVDGVMCNVSLPSEPVEISVRSFTNKRRSFVGSLIGGIAETQEAVDFCASHGIGARVEVIDAGRINEAYQRMLSSDVRYRFAIDTSTI